MSVREKLQDYLSYPPRGLRVDRAAAYLDMSKSKLLSLVDEGIIRQPANLGGVKVWDRADLDAAIEAAKERPDKPPANPIEQHYGLHRNG
jgi:hypothetical protein